MKYTDHEKFRKKRNIAKGTIHMLRRDFGADKNANIDDICHIIMNSGMQPRDVSVVYEGNGYYVIDEIEHVTP